MTQAGMPGDLTGKVIVVTGGAQGIGGAAARICAQRGAQVVIADWNPTTGAKAAATLNEAGYGHRLCRWMCARQRLYRL